jgi:hypothetical protein
MNWSGVVGEVSHGRNVVRFNVSSDVDLELPSHLCDIIAGDLVVVSVARDRVPSGIVQVRATVVQVSTGKATMSAGGMVMRFRGPQCDHFTNGEQLLVTLEYAPSVPDTPRRSSRKRAQR